MRYLPILPALRLHFAFCKFRRPPAAPARRKTYPACHIYRMLEEQGMAGAAFALFDVACSTAPRAARWAFPCSYLSRFSIIGHPSRRAASLPAPPRAALRQEEQRPASEPDEPGVGPSPSRACAWRRCRRAPARRARRHRRSPCMPVFACGAFLLYLPTRLRQQPSHPPPPAAAARRRRAGHGRRKLFACWTFHLYAGRRDPLLHIFAILDLLSGRLLPSVRATSTAAVPRHAAAAGRT